MSSGSSPVGNLQAWIVFSGEIRGRAKKATPVPGPAPKRGSKKAISVVAEVVEEEDEDALVLICDGCGFSSYNKMKLEWETTGAYGMKSGAELVPYYDCDEHDASKIHGFDKLNHIFDHSEIKDQYDYYKDDSDPSPAEEKDNETWKNIQKKFW